MLIFDEAFQTELAGMYRQTGAGLPAIAPAQLAMSVILQGYLGVSDAEAFETCLDSGATELQVLKDFRDGRRYDVTATPTFFINGQRLIGARPFSSFQTLIDAALGEQNR